MNQQIGNTVDLYLLAGPWSSSPPRTIGEAIACHAKREPGKTALTSETGSDLSFRELDECVRSFTAELKRVGLQEGDRVGLLIPPGLPGGALALCVACTSTLVPMNPSLTDNELLEMQENFELDAMMFPNWIGRAPLKTECAVFTVAMANDYHFTLSGSGKTSRRTREHTVDHALLLRSSGTTGRPKIVAVTHQNLIAMAERVSSPKWFGITSDDRAACTLPLHYAAGLKTSLCVPIILGASVCFPQTSRAHAVTEWLEKLRPTYLSVAPPSLNAIVRHLRNCERTPRHSLRFVMSGAAYLAPQLAQEARKLLGVPVIEYYALSEAGVMASTPVAAAGAKPGSVGLPIPGELKLVGPDFGPVQSGEIGQIAISGPSVTPGYVNSGTNSTKIDGWLLTGDLGRFDNDGYLTIVGRAVDVINRGGEKVFPYEVEKHLLQHPAIHEAAVFSAPHPTLGDIVAAALVLKPGANISAHDLRIWLSDRLASFKIPARVHFVSELPRVNGKVSRIRLRESLPDPIDSAEVPDSILEFEILSIWRRLLRRDSIGCDEDFFEAGGDSLLAAEMLAEVEEFTGKAYPQAELTRLTIRHIAEVMLAGIDDENQLLTKVCDGKGTPLFFCHGDYLNRGVYARRLLESLGQDRPIYLLHTSPELHMGMSVEQVAQAYETEVLREADGRPLVLAGFCNGGIIAWHLTHLLRRKGVKVRRLIVIEIPTINWRRTVRFAERVLKMAGSILPGRLGRFLSVDGGRAIWYRLRGHAGLRTMAFGYIRRRITPGKRGAAVQSADLTAIHRSYLRMIACYLPPALDVDVYSIIASDGKQFDTDPTYLLPYAGRLTVMSMPGTHLGAVTLEREKLSEILQKVLVPV